MPVYNYKAINDRNHSVSGSITAANEFDLEDRLKEIGLYVTDARIAKQKRASVFSSVKLKDKIMLCIHLEQLDRAGVPILESLSDIRESSESPKLRDIMTEVYEAVKSGEMLSMALSHHPKIFDSVFIGLIEAGESTGSLYESFRNISNHLKWTNDLRRKVKKAIMYPIFTLLVICSTVAILMINVIPKLKTFLEAQGFELPMHTRALIATSSFFGEYWYLVLPAPAVLVILIKLGCKISDKFDYFCDRAFLKLPYIGPTIRKINLARFNHFFAVLFTSGIDILDCLQGARGVVKNKVLEDSVETVMRSVSDGNSLTNSLKISNQFPNLVIRMFKVGEESGNMKDALENVNYFYDREVNDAVDNIVGVIKPALTILLGLMLGWISLAMFGPLYDSLTKMNI